MDDEPEIRQMLSDAFSMAGHETQVAEDGFQALALIRDQKFDLIVTDLAMPKLDGYELIEKIRLLSPSSGVIALTAKSQREDLRKGFELGVDDYIVKPFSLEELYLRSNAVLRRIHPLEDGTKSLLCGQLSVNLDTRAVQLGDTAIQLSDTEYRLLVFLLERKGKVQSKAILLDAIWGIGFATGVTVLDTYISYLRKKLHGEHFSGIVTVRGVGFKIECEAAN